MTVISHSKKFIFLKAPKTASNSIEKYLSFFLNFDKGDIVGGDIVDSNNGNILRFHLTIPRVKSFLDEYFLDKSIWEDYYKFTTIRNPWDMLLSLAWFNSRSRSPMMHIEKLFNKFGASSLLVEYYIRKYLSEQEYCKQKSRDGLTKYSQYYLESVNGQLHCPLNKVICYENIQDDFGEVCKHLDIPWKGNFEYKGDHLVENSHQRRDRRHYREVYSDRQAERVGELFKEINEFFGYEY